MIQVFLDLLSFLKATFPLLFCVAFFAMFFVLLSKSVKKYYYIYYTLFAIPFLMVVVPSLLRMCGVETSFNFMRIPVVGQILRDYIHMASLGHPLLIVIMYMGALSTKHPYVKRLMIIRKEISIISGFPILTHSWIRTINNFPNSLKYFTSHTEFMENPKVTSVVGAGISNTVLVLGILMLVLFIVLWVTSFDAIHKRMGGRRWKQIQKWSYVLYATLFIHAMGLQVGRMVSASAGNNQVKTEVAENVGKSGQKERTQSNPASPYANNEREGENGNTQQRGRENENSLEGSQRRGRGDGNEQATPQGQSQGHGGGGRTSTTGFADIKVSPAARQWITISSLILVYGSYLILRIRKARKKYKRKRVSTDL